ncbi:MAG: ATP-binding cassette domain-containing protein [Veillonella sp.]|uniref:ABC transporter ATP-binding protein n=1 Tax=Veillonella sp. TaxID=1926307 RepID=UPI0025E7D806|nr:ABC transporter ATP-binding protein [Veillonella sp.]MBS4912951.1 ATP-binding cassette domain-containing protein [Veillonella sp.]
MDILTTDNLSFQNTIQYPDIRIPKEAMTFIQGPSGCGKTTLFKLFNNTLSPSTGTIYLDGKDTRDMNALELRKRILLVNQQAFLFDGTIKDNFEQFYAYRETPVPTQECMDFFLNLAIAPFTVDKEITYLSGGERQRVFNAIMLSLEADVYLWDEPSSALDSATATEFFTNLKEYMKTNHKTSVIISHDKNLYPVFSDQTIVLSAPRKTSPTVVLKSREA